MPSDPHILDIRIEAAGWRRIPRLRARLEKAVAATFAHLPKRFSLPCEITLLLAGDAAMRRLNREFRGVDRPTNVLSFPQYDAAKLPKKGRAGEVVSLGDIVMAYQYIVVEAKKDHKMLINHVTHLLIHGILHLFGYDHAFDSQAARMEGLEKRIMASLGLPDPYVPRTPKAKSAATRKK